MVRDPYARKRFNFLVTATAVMLFISIFLACGLLSRLQGQSVYTSVGVQGPATLGSCSQTGTNNAACEATWNLGWGIGAGADSDRDLTLGER